MTSHRHASYHDRAVAAAARKGRGDADATAASTMSAVEPAIGERIRATIDAGRDDADRIVAIASREANRIVAVAEGADRALAAGRVERLRDLGREIEDQQRRIQSGYAAMIEAMATSSMKLVEAARDADFSAPPRPSALGRTVEVRLAQTREISFRIESGGGTGRGPSFAV
jgi:hypothetical protein